MALRSPVSEACVVSSDVRPVGQDVIDLVALLYSTACDGVRGRN